MAVEQFPLLRLWRSRGGSHERLAVLAAEATSARGLSVLDLEPRNQGPSYSDLDSTASSLHDDPTPPRALKLERYHGIGSPSASSRHEARTQLRPTATPLSDHTSRVPHLSGSVRKVGLSLFPTL